MGRAGKALHQVLLEYQIPQNHLAIMMDIDRSNVSRWVNETRDPSAESVADLKNALTDIQVEAGDDFVQYFLYNKPLTLVPIKEEEEFDEYEDDDDEDEESLLERVL